MIQSAAQQTGVSEDMVSSYIKDMSDEEISGMFTQAVTERVKAQYAATVKEQMSALYASQLAGALTYALPGYTTEHCAAFFDEIINFSESTYEGVLTTIGYVDLEAPKTISIYASPLKTRRPSKRPSPTTTHGGRVRQDSVYGLRRPDDVLGRVHYRQHHLCADSVRGHLTDCFLHYDRRNYVDFRAGAHKGNRYSARHRRVQA